MDTVINEAMTPMPLDFQDAFIYSHGWSTDAVRSMDLYGRFSVELDKVIHSTITPQTLASFHNPPRNTFGIGIHWPSDITENPTGVLNDLQMLSFYTMEHRADVVGSNAVYSVLRLLLSARQSPQTVPLRINLIGHSFGCRVVCSALQGIQNDVNKGLFDVRTGTRFNAILLQGAADADSLEVDNAYGGLQKLPVRLLMTYSSLDEACVKWYPLASKVANLFRSPKTALGAAGPSQNTIQQYGSHVSINPSPGNADAAALDTHARLTLVNLTALHQANTQYQGGVSGHHSDINLPEIYQLITDFVYR
jgi:hypothetical protein